MPNACSAQAALHTLGPTHPMHHINNMMRLYIHTHVHIHMYLQTQNCRMLCALFWCAFERNGILPCTRLARVRYTAEAPIKIIQLSNSVHGMHMRIHVCVCVRVACNRATVRWFIQPYLFGYDTDGHGLRLNI